MVLDWSWSDLSGADWLWVLLLLAAAIGPYIAARRNKTSLALATVLSILLVWMTQMLLLLLRIKGFTDFHPYEVFAGRPIWQDDPTQIHRFITAAWLHSEVSLSRGIDIAHVLGNVLVIALVGVPLEQRLGPRRWLVIYLAGAVAGNITWFLAHPDSVSYSLGASGAAFGLLGCYLACWPNDQIEFPLFLIRKWPVVFIALLKFGIELIQVGTQYGGFASTSNIAHLAHVGGFFVCYAIGRPLARGGLIPPEVNDGGPTAASAEEARVDGLKRRMGDLTDDPWSAAGSALEGRAARTLERLREEGDELETRQAWLEQLAEDANCPQCGAELKTSDNAGIFSIECTKATQHLRWP
jgi:membrane associated rhomboid family serine protease